MLLTQGNLGIAKCRDLAKHSVWWPNMSHYIAERVCNCESCRRHSHLVQQPLVRSKFLDRPGQRLGSDLFYFQERWYVVIIYYYQRYVEVDILPELNSRTMILKMKDVFARHGIPEVIVSDNGPQDANGRVQEIH